MLFEKFEVNKQIFLTKDVSDSPQREVGTISMGRLVHFMHGSHVVAIVERRAPRLVVAAQQQVRLEWTLTQRRR